MFCSNCGTEVSNGDHYCPKCGSKLDISQNPVNNDKVQYMIVEKKQINYALIGFLSAIAILPLSLIIRFAFAKTVVRYGWREYTATVLPDGLKVLGVIVILALLAVSITCLNCFHKKFIGRKNKFKIPTIIIDVIATILSFAFIFG